MSCQFGRSHCTLNFFYFYFFLHTIELIMATVGILLLSGSLIASITTAAGIKPRQLAQSIRAIVSHILHVSIPSLHLLPQEIALSLTEGSRTTTVSCYMQDGA